jgi:hypothetical protein
LKGTWLRTRADFDFSEWFALHCDQLFEPDQLEQRQKGDYDLRTAGNSGEQSRKLQLAGCADPLHQLLDFFTDRPFILENIAQVLALIEALEDGVDGINEVED